MANLEPKVNLRETNASPDRYYDQQAIADEQPCLELDRHVWPDKQEEDGTEHTEDRLG